MTVRRFRPVLVQAGDEQFEVHLGSQEKRPRVYRRLAGGRLRRVAEDDAETLQRVAAAMQAGVQARRAAEEEAVKRATSRRARFLRWVGALLARIQHAVVEFMWGLGEAVGIDRRRVVQEEQSERFREVVDEYKDGLSKRAKKRLRRWKQ